MSAVRPRTVAIALAFALILALCVGVAGRGYWTPDEPREADIAWRMSWQSDKAVPLLAGEAFCEKPPLAYWLAGASISALGADAWAARLPNLIYALITALSVGALGRRSAGALAGWAAAAAISTFLLSYQVAIWLATDAPLLAAVSAALLGLYIGFYAEKRSTRLGGYTCMHAALAVGFLCKSAAAWMVPALTFLALVLWEKRWRELLRWELYAGLLLQALIIVPWIESVYRGPDGPAHLKVFLWNNLAGRFVHIDAPAELQYAAAHKNSPGKYFAELPVYLWPWTLLVAAAVRAAWVQRRADFDNRRAVRFAVATVVPTLVVLSLSATARNIYLAPALPGTALLLGWWVGALPETHDLWDGRAVRCTAILMLTAMLVLAAAAAIVGVDSWDGSNDHGLFFLVSGGGLLVCAALSVFALRSRRAGLLPAVCALLFAYCALLSGPASQIYGRVNAWQDLAVIGRAIARDAVGRPLILFAADETTRAFVDMYARTSVDVISAPLTSLAVGRLREKMGSDPDSRVLAQVPGRTGSATLRNFADRMGLAHWIPAEVAIDRAPAWAAGAQLHAVRIYALPNGRRYALFERNSSISR